MSDLYVTISKIDHIIEHTNAKNLEIAIIGGWQIVIGKGNYNVGDVVVHIPPDSMVPKTWADQWGVTQYLSFKKNEDVGRVRAAKLRGVTSFGFLVSNESNAPLGTDLASHYGITKYEPPPPPVGMSAGQMYKQHPLFHTYTDIQNLRNFPDKLNYGEPMVCLEKIHGTNSRVGWIRKVGQSINPYTGNSFVDWLDHQFEFVVGTHHTQRDPNNCGVYGSAIQVCKIMFIDIVRHIIDWQAWKETNSIIFFGEIYGAGVQDLHYGQKTEKGYRVFDIAVNGEYLPWSTLEFFQERYGLPLVPVITRGIMDFDQLIEEAQGSTTLADLHIREGIVVRPWISERTWKKGDLDPNPKRMIFKVISNEYLLRKNGTEYH